MIMVARENPVALSASPELLEPFAKDIKVYTECILTPKIQHMHKKLKKGGGVVGGCLSQRGSPVQKTCVPRVGFLPKNYTCS